MREYFVSEITYNAFSDCKEKERIADEKEVISLLENLKEDYKPILENVDKGNKYFKVLNRPECSYSSEEYRLCICTKEKGETMSKLKKFGRR